MSTDYIFSEFELEDKTLLMKLMLDYLYDDMSAKFDQDMMDYVQEKLMEEDNCPHCGDDRGDHDISDRNRLIPCESDGEGEFELKLCRTAGLW